MITEAFKLHTRFTEAGQYIFFRSTAQLLPLECDHAEPHRRLHWPWQEIWVPFTHLHSKYTLVYEQDSVSCNEGKGGKKKRQNDSLLEIVQRCSSAQVSWFKMIGSLKANIKTANFQGPVGFTGASTDINQSSAPFRSKGVTPAPLRFCLFVFYWFILFYFIYEFILICYLDKPDGESAWRGCAGGDGGQHGKHLKQSDESHLSQFTQYLRVGSKWWCIFLQQPHCCHCIMKV